MQNDKEQNENENENENEDGYMRNILSICKSSWSDRINKKNYWWSKPHFT